MTSNRHASRAARRPQSARALPNGRLPNGPLPKGVRRGAALVITLVCLVVLGVLAAGGFAAARQSFRGGRNALVEQRAFGVAELGLNQQMSQWDPSFNLAPAASPMKVGSIADSNVFVSNGDTARVRITRLGAMLYWIESIGRANIPNPNLQATRDISALVRLAYPTISPKGAVTVDGDIDINGAASVDGRDHIPYAGTSEAWSAAQCASMTGPDMPALVAPPGAKVTYKPGSIPSTPAVVYDPAASDSETYVRYGTESWNTLAAHAMQLPGGIYGTAIQPSLNGSGKCDLTNANNWGEPWYDASAVAPCHGYFPIIYLNGSATINGKGRGQGILLVNGDLKINGNSATAVIYVPGNTSMTFTFASDPVTAQGEQTMKVSAGAFTRGSDSAAVTPTR